jgi:hypothetical protein
MMGIARHRRRRSAAGGTLLAVVLLAACAVMPARLSGNHYVYEDPVAAGGFPVDENILIGYVDAQDLRVMRAHAWKLWAGLTAPSRSTWNGQDLPVFETWYSATEVFEDRYRDRASSRPRAFVRKLEVPKQSLHTRSAAAPAGAGVLSFVKLNEPAEL